MKKSVGDLASFLEELYRMKQTNDLPDQKRQKFYDLLITQREAFDRFYNDQVSTFRTVASSFLAELDDVDIAALYASFPSGQFTKSGTEYFKYVEAQVSEYLKGQLKKKLRDLWVEKTGTKDPVDWSARYDMPILCMFDDEARGEARSIFRIMGDNSPSEADANRALRYLEKATFYGNRAGTENVAAIVGMATALKNNCNHLEKNQEHVLALENQLFQELDDLGVKYVRNGGNSTLPGLISLSFPGKDGEAILHRMDLKGIAISTGSACDSKRTEISHVLRAINLEEQSALGTIRVSLGKNNSKENVSTIAATLAGILQ